MNQFELKMCTRIHNCQLQLTISLPLGNISVCYDFFGRKIEHNCEEEVMEATINPSTGAIRLAQLHKLSTVQSFLHMLHLLFSTVPERYSIPPLQGIRR
jgi:hypothetical protein